jgi:hypothetical protein
VLEVLRSDYSQAVADGDLRSALISAVALDKLDADGAEGRRGDLETLRQRTIAEALPAESVWKVESITAEVLPGDYTEDISGMGEFRIKPTAGHRVVRVRGKATNASQSPDLPYVLWTLVDNKGESARLELATEPGGPGRLALDDFLYLVTGDGPWIECAHVCRGSTLRDLNSTWYHFNDASFLSAIGPFVATGDSMNIDVIFSVPQGIDRGKLVILGSAPVDVEFEAP